MDPTLILRTKAQERIGKILDAQYIKLQQNRHDSFLELFSLKNI